MTEADGRSPAELFARLPVGHSIVEHDGRRWSAVRSVQVGGRSQKVFAEELGGSDVVSANLYLVGDAEELRPCEMSAEKVLDFLGGFRLVGSGRQGRTNTPRRAAGRKPADS